MKTKKKWLRPRHKVITFILKIFFVPYAFFLYGYRYQKNKLPKNQPYLILYNHQTTFDQFLLGISFNRPLYYVASEDLFSIKFVSPLIRYLVAPIPFKKSTKDLTAVKTCLKVAKEGGTIAISPEGNRTFSGKTESIKPSIAKFIKALRIPVIFFHFEGGYGIKPRWADQRRKGRMKGVITKIITPEEYLDLSNQELHNLVKENLMVDETSSDQEFKCRKLAERIERVIYLCPKCGISHFKSHHDRLMCLNCGLEVTYTTKKQFEGPIPYQNIDQWYQAQEAYIRAFDFNHNIGELFNDQIQLFEVVPYKKKQVIAKSCLLHLVITSYDQVEYRFKLANGNDLVFDFNEITAVSVLGRNKMNIYYQDKLYQVKGEVGFNPVKYLHIYYHYKYLHQESNDGYDYEYLGL